MLTLLLLTCAVQAQAPDLVIYHGVIHPDADVVETAATLPTAIALRDGRVLALGSDEDILALADADTERWDIHGRHVYPGFTDAHIHLMGLGGAELNLDLMGTESWEDIVALALEWRQSHGEDSWIVGRGWDQNDWRNTDFPVHHRLSEALPETPVVLVRVDGHALIANAAAMRLAGVTKDTPDPPGGRILRDQNGELTGVFVDTAESLLWRVVPAANGEQELRKKALLAQKRLHQHGITSAHDAGVGPAALAVFTQMAKEESLQLRVHAMLNGSNETQLQEWFARGPAHDVTGNGRLAVRSIKLYADGALGSRGAHMLADYSDEQGNRGLAISTAEQIAKVAERAFASGFQVCTHAIGDRGNRIVLDVYERIAGKALERLRAGRWRVEHAQIIALEDIPRFGSLGVVPSMQPQHQTSDMPWAEERVGPERIRGAYAWRSLLDGGVRIPSGSDAPVERLDSLAAYLAAVSRQTRAGQPAGGWYPEERMTPQEARQSMTTWAAWSAFREDDLGKLLPGYHADLVLLSKPLDIVEPKAVGQIEIEATVFAGEVVYRRASR